MGLKEYHIVHHTDLSCIDVVRGVPAMLLSLYGVSVAALLSGTELSRKGEAQLLRN